MASITLKNIPEELHALYKRRAAKNRRSLQAEILKTLEECGSEKSLEKNLKAADLAGILTSDVKGISVEEMSRGIDEMFGREWKR